MAPYIPGWDCHGFARFEHKGRASLIGKAGNESVLTKDFRAKVP